MLRQENGITRPERDAHVRREAEWIASQYEQVDTHPNGTRVRVLETGEIGTITDYDFGSALVVFPETPPGSFRNEALELVETERIEVGDHVEVGEFDPTQVGEFGVVEIVGSEGQRVQIRRPDGVIFTTWASCLEQGDAPPLTLRTGATVQAILE